MINRILSLQELYTIMQTTKYWCDISKDFNICEIDRFEVFVDNNEGKLIKVLLMKALAQMVV
jgi:hypothetical protein